MSKELQKIKDNIGTAYSYFAENYKRYHEFMNFIYKSSINSNQEAVLRLLQKPNLEFNILEAYINRLLGEFAMQEPSIVVSPSDGMEVPRLVIDLVEGHLRHILYEAEKANVQYEMYREQLSGGFSVAKVWTEYENPMSMRQVIRFGKVFDPTLVGFDPLAREPHKADARWCFELFPMTDEEFSSEYPDVNLTQLDYSKNLDGFSWSYKAKNDKFILVADYWEKKRKRQRIVELSDGRVMTQNNYKKMVADWEEFSQPPVVVGEPRWTLIDIICRYRLIENQILSYEETDYAFLPYVFLDGNSAILRNYNLGDSYQMTRPYVYQAKGIQQLKNFAGLTIAGNIQNQIQSKFIIKKEAIPSEQEYKDSLQNIQQASTIVVQAYSENNPEQAIPEPIIPVTQAATPPETLNAFSVSDPTTQMILGSFSSNLAKNDQHLSGKAVIESASVNNAASMPFLTNFLSGFAQIANVMVDLMPKYLLKKRKLPVRMSNGDTHYIQINYKDFPELVYLPGALKVNIEAGVNTQIQKNQAMQQVLGLMQASEQFGSFMNSPEGLKVLVKNLTIYGADELKEAIPKWLEAQAQQAQQMQQMQEEQAKNNPLMIEAQSDMIRAQAQAKEAELRAEKAKLEAQIEIAKLAIEQQRVQNESMLAQSKVAVEDEKAALAREKAEVEVVSDALKAASEMIETKGRENEIQAELQ